MLFVGVKAEPDTRLLRDVAHHAGKRVVLPRVVGRDIVALPDAGMLEVSNFGVPEPAFPSPESSAVSPDEIDLVIVPGLAFDADNFRVGYGGGFYDRFLPTLRADAVTIGVGFVEQLVEAVPRQAHDVALHRVVTA